MKKRKTKYEFNVLNEKLFILLTKIKSKHISDVIFLFFLFRNLMKRNRYTAHFAVTCLLSVLSVIVVVILFA